MPFFPNSSLLVKNNAQNIKHMPVLIFHRCLDLRKNVYSRTSSEGNLHLHSLTVLFKGKWERGL